MKYFVDKDRNPESVYGKYGKGEWVVIRTIADFKEAILNDIGEGRLPDDISFNYTMEKDGDGITLLKYLINICIKINFKLPRIYSHDLDRKYSIFYENELDIYTKRMDIPYYFEHIKQI